MWNRNGPPKPCRPAPVGRLGGQPFRPDGQGARLVFGRTSSGSWSIGAALEVIVAPKDHPPAGRWWGATAMDANEVDRRRYEEEP